MSAEPCVAHAFEGCRICTSAPRHTRPIIMQSWSVRAILEGRKVQTRRLLTPGWVTLDGYRISGRRSLQELDWRTAELCTDHPITGAPDHYLRVRYNQQGTMHTVRPVARVGDVLGVLEQWGGDNLCGYAYRADHPDWPKFQGDGEQPDSDWKSPIHMPRKLCRLELQVTAVRFERLQDICGQDCIHEGAWREEDKALGRAQEAIAAFATLWASLHPRPPHDWNSDPWVVVLTFEAMVR